MIYVEWLWSAFLYTFVKCAFEMMSKPSEIRLKVIMTAFLIFIMVFKNDTFTLYSHNSKFIYCHLLLFFERGCNQSNLV